MAMWETAILASAIVATASSENLASPALIGTWVAIAVGFSGLFLNSRREMRESRKDLDERIKTILRGVLADPDFQKSQDQRTQWIAADRVSTAFAERASSFVSRERYDERNAAINERFAAFDKHLAEINTKLDKMPEMMRREITFVMSQYIVVGRGKDSNLHD